MSQAAGEHDRLAAAQGEAADFKAKTLNLIAATEEVVAKNPAGVAHYKDAVNCMACHSEHKPD